MFLIAIFAVIAMLVDGSYSEANFASISQQSRGDRGELRCSRNWKGRPVLSLSCLTFSRRRPLQSGLCCVLFLCVSLFSFFLLGTGQNIWN